MGARTCPVANNQAQVCVLQCHFSCKVSPLLGHPPARLAISVEHQNVYSTSWIRISRDFLFQKSFSIAVNIWYIHYRIYLVNVYGIYVTFLYVCNIYKYPTRNQFLGKFIIYNEDGARKAPHRRYIHFVRKFSNNFKTYRQPPILPSLNLLCFTPTDMPFALHGILRPNSE